MEDPDLVDQLEGGDILLVLQQTIGLNDVGFFDGATVYLGLHHLKQLGRNKNLLQIKKRKKKFIKYLFII